MGGDAGLVGRSEEYERATELVAAGQNVVLAGVPGVGKTRLARELATAAGGAGRRLMWAAGTGSTRELPLGALAGWLSASEGGDLLSWSPLEVLALLRRGHGGNAEPSLFVVDDAHLLDPASATVVFQLALAPWATVVATVTTGAACVEPVRTLWKDELAERVELQSLSREENDELVGALLGGPCAAAALHDIWEVAQGNPLYVRELVTSAVDAGALAPVDGRWVPMAPLPVGKRLAELVETRVLRAERDGREVLDAVVLADPAPLGLLECLFSGDVLARAEEAQLVRIIADGDRQLLRPAHPVYGEVARALMPAMRRRRLSRSLAEAIAATGMRRPGDDLRYVMWLLEAGEEPPVDLLLSAAWASSEALDAAGAERLARAAARVAPDDERVPLALADALYRQHRHEEAIAVLERAPLGGASELALVERAWLHAKVLWFGSDDTAAALEVLTTGEERSLDAECRRWLRLYRARLEVAAGRPERGLELNDPMPDAGAPAPLRLLALGTAATAHAFMGRSARAIELAREADVVRHGEGGRAHIIAGWIAPTSWVASFLSGDLEGAKATAEMFRARGLAQRHAFSVAVGSLGRAWVSILAGDVRAARQHLADVGESEQLEDWVGARRLAVAGWAWAHAWSGEPGAAEALLGAAKAGKSGTRWFEPLVDMAGAWALAARGDANGAAGRLAAIGERAAADGFAPYAVLAHYGAARLAPTAHAGGRVLQNAAAAVDGSLAPLALSHVEALARRDAGALEGAGDRLDAAGFVLTGAEAWAAASALRARAGDDGGAEASRARVEVLLSRCPGAVSPVLARLAMRGRLTPREAHIAALAASGRSSRDIADELCLSVRTVDSHLAHVYAKLGVSGRNELPPTLAGAALENR